MPAEARKDALDWAEAVERLSGHSGVVMMVGATDVGKSTLTLEAANAALRAGRRPAILDTDVGQGEVGPPGTIGLVRPETPVAAISELKPRLLGFVGATTAYGHLITLVQETHRLVRHAQRQRDDLVLVDTSGLVHGRLAERLKLAKVEVLEPSLVVCVEKEQELERLSAMIAASTTAPLVTVRAPPDVRVKSPVYRRIRRAHRLRRHFEHARILEMDASQVRVVEAWLYNGTTLPARQLRTAAAALDTDVPHGEITPDGVFLCVAGRVEKQGFVVLQEEFGRKRITVTPATTFQNLMVGMVGEGGFLVDVALLQGINFERSLFSLLTPARSAADVRLLQFGRLRARGDGSEIAHLRPADL